MSLRPCLLARTSSNRRSILPLCSSLTLLSLAWLPSIAVAQLGLADPYVSSSAGVNGNLSSYICGMFTTGNFGLYCSYNVVNGDNLNDGDFTDIPNDVAHASGAAESVFADFGTPFFIVGHGVGSADAATNPWENRARASASGATPNTPGLENTVDPGFTPSDRYAEHYVLASGESEWMEHLTLNGPQPGTAILRFAIDGSRSETMYGPFPGMPGSMTFDFRLYDPETGDPGDPGSSIAGGTVAYEGTGDVVDELEVAFDFVPGKTYLAVGRLEVRASAGGVHGVMCELGGYHCVVGSASYAAANYDFFNTVFASSLEVPAGTTATGSFGSPLPFPVPEPALPAAGLAGLLGLVQLARWRAGGSRRLPAHARVTRLDVGGGEGDADECGLTRSSGEMNQTRQVEDGVAGSEPPIDRDSAHPDIQSAGARIAPNSPRSRAARSRRRLRPGLRRSRGLRPRRLSH